MISSLAFEWKNNQLEIAWMFTRSAYSWNDTMLYLGKITPEQHKEKEEEIEKGHDKKVAKILKEFRDAT